MIESGKLGPEQTRYPQSPGRVQVIPLEKPLSSYAAIYLTFFLTFLH